MVRKHNRYAKGTYKPGRRIRIKSTGETGLIVRHGAVRTLARPDGVQYWVLLDVPRASQVNPSARPITHVWAWHGEVDAAT